MKLLPTIACIRLHDVSRGFDELKAWAMPIEFDDNGDQLQDDDLLDLFDYFERTYLGRPPMVPLIAPVDILFEQ
jgi:hypothetical protein